MQSTSQRDRPGAIGVSAPHDHQPTAPTVLFIGGYGRSGSTLLDRVLGSSPGCFSAGEVRHIWREGYIENRLCGCGARFLDCPFWQRVTDRAFPGGADVHRIVATKERVDRYQRIPQLVTGLARRARRDDLRWYADQLRSLYGAIADESGASVVIDSSKDVSHGYVLCRVEPSIDLFVLHLVRDSRAVAHSWGRRKFNPGSGREMDRISLARTSAEWVAINALTAAQRRRGADRFARLRYEDLVADPATWAERVLRFAGVTAGRPAIGPEGEIELGASHTVAGNPMRFQNGSMRIRADDEWRDRMPASSRCAVTALTFPVLAATSRSTV